MRLTPPRLKRGAALPRRGHRIGPPGCPPELRHHEQRLGILLSASKLTRTKRELARLDSAVAEHFRKRIREPERFEAFLAGRSRYISDTPCRCGSSIRTVYCASCWTCQTTRRPLQLTAAGKVAAWPPALRSRAGWLALCEQRQRERNGERDSRTFGHFTATTTPTGKLSISAPAVGISVPDLGALPFDSINNLVRLYPEVLDALRWAGWT
jgi:hypothetical protein